MATNTNNQPETVADPTVYAVAVGYGAELDAQGFRTLQTVRRSLLGMLHHGFITELETHQRTGVTVWSWRRGSEEPAGIRDGVLHVLESIAPTSWTIK